MSSNEIVEKLFSKEIYKKINQDKNEYLSTMGLPVEFYRYYRDKLIEYKDKGLTQQEMINILTRIYKESEDIAEFVYELLDLVYGYCSADYKIFKD